MTPKTTPGAPGSGSALAGDLVRAAGSNQVQHHVVAAGRPVAHGVDDRVVHGHVRGVRRAGAERGRVHRRPPTDVVLVAAAGALEGRREPPPRRPGVGRGVVTVGDAIGGTGGDTGGDTGGETAIGWVRVAAGDSRHRYADTCSIDHREAGSLAIVAESTGPSQPASGTVGGSAWTI